MTPNFQHRPNIQSLISNIMKQKIIPLETALQKQFKADAGIVRKAFELVEENRATFAVNALKFGLCALAAKSVVGHGKFGKWLAEALSEGGNARPIAERTAKDYMGLARVFVEKFSAPNKLSGRFAEAVELFKEQVDSSFDIGIVLSNAKHTEFLLNSTVSGMTLTQLRQLLREGAERAYSDEQAEKAITKPTPRGLREGGAAESPQMLLWEDWTNELESIDRLFEAPEKQLLDPEHWLQVESKLVVWLESVRKITRGLRK